MATVRFSRASDVPILAANLREADRAELEALGTTPLPSLAHGFVHSRPPHTILVEDEPVGMFGAVPLSPGVGAVWLLGTDKLVQGVTKWEFLHQCRGWVGELQRGYHVLTNIVDHRNAVHRKWIKWCGFKFLHEVVIHDHTFIQFERRS